MTDFGPIPDGTNWIDAYGRPWVAHGDDLILWADPIITLLGDNPQKMVQGSPYVEAGATAVDAEGTDITASIIIDTSGLDTDTPGDYPVVYTITDQYGQTDEQTRTVRVLNLHRPELREDLYDLIRAGMPDGTYVYKSPAEQVQTPAVVIGTMSWRPDRMNSLDYLEWSITIRLVLPRTAPDYGVITLETLAIKVAMLLLGSGFRVEGFDDESGSNIGGPEYLTGTLTVIYKQAKEG